MSAEDAMLKASNDFTQATASYEQLKRLLLYKALANTLSQAVSSCLRRSVHARWWQWWRSTTEAQRREDQQRRSLHHWRRSVYRRYLHRWHRQTKASVQQKAQRQTWMRRAVVHAAKKTLYMAFRRWNTLLLLGQEEQAQRRQRQQLLNILLSRKDQTQLMHTRASMLRCFLVWKHDNAKTKQQDDYHKKLQEMDSVIRSAAGTCLFFDFMCFFFMCQLLQSTPLVHFFHLECLRHLVILIQIFAFVLYTFFLFNARRSKHFVVLFLSYRDTNGGATIGVANAWN